MIFRGERLAAVRRRRGLSQVELAGVIGAASRERISQWERGVEQPHPRYLRAVAAALGVDPVDLLDVGAGALTLREVRVAAGLSLRDVHESAGLPYSRYYRLASGVGAAPPPEAVVARVAAVLDVEVDVVRSGIETAWQQRRALRS